MRLRDIHCHILPGLDDGAEDWTQCIDMIRHAYERGTRAFIATPHYSMQFPRTSPGEIVRLCRQAELEVKKQMGCKIHIYPGNEIYYYHRILKDLAEGKVLPLANSQYVLVEFPPMVSYKELERVIRELTLAQYWPVLAHVERYSCLRKPGRPEELVRLGAYLQINGNSLKGGFLDERAEWCKKMLMREQIHFVASDMHNLTTRKAISERAEVWMRKKLSPNYRKILFWDHPDMVIRNQKINNEN